MDPDIDDHVRRLAARGVGVQRIAAQTGLDVECVEAILSGKPWRHLVTPRAMRDLFGLVV